MTARRALLAALVLAAGCATNPVTGKRQLSFISEKDEIALGQQSAEQVKSQMATYPDQKVQQYVSAIGMRMAKASERPDLPWSFTVLDDATVNAFALPGGPIFVTRGILTHMTSEAELASVLGHEIGHVTARHSVEQLSKQQLAQVGLGVGMILSPELANVGQAAMAGMQLLFLKYGRDAERQSDELGFKYMLAQSYDPKEMPKMFATLARASALSGGGRMPEWQSTHPDPENREEVAAERASKVPPGKNLKVGQDEFLAMTANMPFGEDPRQGYFQGNTFLHPELKFRLQLPEGWKAQNTAQALMAVSPKQDAAIQLTLAGNMTPQQASQQFLSQKGIQPVPAQSVAAGGLPPNSSYFQAQTEQGPVGGLVSFISHGGLTYQIVGFTGAQALQAQDPAFRQTIASFGPLNDPAAAAVQPARVQLVKAPRDMTVAEFNAQFPSTIPVEQVAVINGQDPKEGRFKAGQTVKRVVGGVKPQGQAQR